MCWDNEKQLCSSPCSVSCVCHKWVVEIQSEWSISYWTVPFFIADNWRWLRSRASVRLNLTGNLLSLMSDVDLHYLMKLGPQWNGFYHAEWAGRALFHFSVFCFVFLFNLIPPLVLWQKRHKRAGILSKPGLCTTKQKQICRKGNWNHMDFYVTYVWAVLGYCCGTRGPGDLPEVTLTLGLQAQLPLSWPR